ncbi:acyl-CoA dehydrogenase [Clostridium gasigenes]|uniref:Acyl-CoA dehydrogenase n=1 Tax=Clostridium gasigenes TaxID=94869 RepID=A0A1H0SRP2_9CLOT|nr:acyl-CoA dehydrogenase [Clostridium gasigenes]MBB6623443.1 acyl-CoA dehydrogenase [Clostridium gasigenes]MBB6715316.1 acyl-CoA dehydrogenase [Clostridium gasigenes]MBU3089664.1 acyl-CoA dehydrogenase [Clostridium gasigenes]MBU3104735.1 acyl-CoA dehydrogenase [Clostridium gasigenes]MBU3108525.1 acyl-CoA dehydrogenase [Clostridium gasigenes]
MNFTLTREQELVRQMVREFAINEVKPIAAEIDQTERFPMENVEKMAKLGMLGIPFSKEYGGAGGDTLSYILTVEELSKVCGTTGVIVSAHTSLCASLINQFGNADQKVKYLTPLAKGEKLGAFGLTEPGAGTDASGQQTTAVLDGDNYILNGSKIFITNGGVAETFIIFAMTDRSKGTKGISTFIVEKDFPGFSIGKHEDKLGIRASSTTELVMQNCIVPKENLIGQEGRGFGVAMKTLDGGRIGIAAQALGIAEGALEEACTYMKERKQFGKPLSAFQGLQWMIADMDVRVESARLLVYKAAFLKDAGLPYAVDAARAKLVASEVAMEVTTKAVQIFGGYGYTKEYPVERMMRDAKITEIYEGTSEVQKMVIAGSALR